MATKKKVHRKKSGGTHRKKRRVGSPVIAGTKRRRKRKVGTVSGSEGMDTLIGGAAGIAGAILINKFAPGPDMVKAGIELVGGGAAAYMGVKKKKPMMTGFGIGMASVGAVGVAKGAGLISGAEEFISGIGFDELAGADDTVLVRMEGVNGTNLDLPLVAGESDNSNVSGEPDSGFNGVY